MYYNDFQDLKLSGLGLGCMRLPCIDGDDSRPDPHAVQEMVDYAMANGINYFDTAWGYHAGNSETVVGEALSKYDRSSFYLASKFPGYDLSNFGKHEEIFYKQLEKCKTDYFDFYLYHNVCEMNIDKYLDDSTGLTEFLLKMKEKGKIRHLGFSCHGTQETMHRFIMKNFRHLEFCQIQLNYLDYDDPNLPGGPVYEVCRKFGKGVLVMEPCKGGSLAQLPEEAAEVFRALGGSPASYAIRYAASFEGVFMVLSGMSTMEQVEDNLKTFASFKPLSEAEQKGIADIVTTMRSRVQNGCTGCRYCMPCPFGVDIPGSFRAWNNYYMYENYNNVKWAWENEIGESHQPKNCAECGKCEAACPQKIAIREDLKKAQADLDKKEMIR